MKNLRVRKALADHSMTQGDLARLLGFTEPEMSRILKFELARSEQDKFIEKIRATNSEDPA
jgi:predicted XRE-type DNA-binding protein